MPSTATLDLATMSVPQLRQELARIIHGIDFGTARGPAAEARRAALQAQLSAALREQVAQRAAAPLRSKRAQSLDTDGLPLFGDQRHQADMLDLL